MYERCVLDMMHAKITPWKITLGIWLFRTRKDETRKLCIDVMMCRTPAVASVPAMISGGFWLGGIKSTPVPTPNTKMTPSPSPLWFSLTFWFLLLRSAVWSSWQQIFFPDHHVKENCVASRNSPRFKVLNQFTSTYSYYG